MPRREGDMPSMQVMSETLYGDAISLEIRLSLERAPSGVHIEKVIGSKTNERPMAKQLPLFAQVLGYIEWMAGLEGGGRPFTSAP